ncbi:MAG: hypothetical protein ACTHMY_16720 [Solirubrobacteraceae bacterium]
MTPFQQPTHNVTPDPPNTRLPVPNDDDGDGFFLFLVFTIAMLASTAAVVLIALLGEWWVFGFGLAIHAIMTVIVVVTIAQVMAGRHRSTAARHALPNTSLSTRSSPARSHQTGARTTIASTAGSPATALQLRTHHLAPQDDHGPNQPTMASARREPDELAGGRSAGAGNHREPRGRPGADTQASPLESDGLRRASRVLVVTDETLASANAVPQPILDQIERADEVYVVAPTLTTWLQSLTGDIDGARASADERLRTVFDHMDASGLEAHGTVGDEDQVSALADALDGFSADLVLLRLHAPGSQNENWREHRLVAWVRTHTTVPTIVFYFDDEGQFVGRQDAIAPVADAA